MPTLCIKEQGFLEVNTLEGVERLFSGEVVVKGVKGEFYPVSYENFVKVYDILIKITKLHN